MEKEKTEELMELKVGDCIPTSDNCRIINEKSAEFRELVESIRADGVKMHVGVRPHPTKKGKYDLRCGSRRHRAATIAKRETIPAVVHLDMSDTEAFDLTFFENFSREDLKPMEEARVVEILMERHGDDVAAVASKMGWSERAVRKRVQIRKLTTKWKKFMNGNGAGAGNMTPGHLETIARLPVASQDDLFKTKHKWCQWGGQVLSIKNLRRNVAEYTRALSGAMWKLDDVTLTPQVGSCLDCRQRSDTNAQKDLWDDGTNGKKKPGARCLDAKCWKEKSEAAFGLRLLDLHKEHKNLVFVSGEGAYEDKDPLPTGKKQVLCNYDYRSCKKTEKGAVPALVVAGTGKGSLRWILQGHSSGRSSLPLGPSSLKQRKAKLDARRWAQLLADLRDAIRRAPISSVKKKDKTKAIIALATVFGTMENHTNWHPPHWDVFEKAYMVGKRGDLWAQVREVLAVRCTYSGGITQTPIGVTMEAKLVASLLGIDIKAMLKKISETKGFTEPKGWKNLNADGTPKTKKKRAGKK